MTPPNPVLQMTRRFQLCLWLGLCLVSCDKPAPPNTRSGETEAAPRIRNDTRPPRVDAPDPQEELRLALKAASELAVPAARDQAIAEIAWNALETDPDLAREAFQQLPADSVEKIRLIRHFAMRLAEQNLDEALTWAATLGTEKEIAAAHGQIALVISNTEPERAAKLLSDSGVAGREFDVSVVQVVQRWAATSPPDAAAWVALFPPGKFRQAGIQTVVSQWATTDAPATLAWMATLQDEALRKETALAMAQALLQQPPEVRDAWLQHADAGILGEIEQQRDQAVKAAGKQVPPASK